MKKVTVCLDEATAALVKQIAKAKGQSTSRWVADIIRKEVALEWPQDCLALAGRFVDFPLREGSTASCSEDSYSAAPHANACK
jgi:hypothetical protein